MIVINTQISQSFLTGIINTQLDEIFGHKIGETNKVDLKLERVGDVKVSLYENDIIIEAPLEVNVKKGDGLFKAEAHGRINVEIKIELNIDEDLRASTKTSIVGYSWVDKPVLDIGAFEVSIEKLTDLGIKYYEPSISGAIDSKLKSLLNFNQLIDRNLEKVRTLSKGKLPEGININIIPKGFILEQFQTSKGNICIKAGVDPIVQIASNELKSKVKKSFRWVDKLDENSLGFIHFEIELVTLKNLILESMRNQNFGGRKVEMTALDLKIVEDQVIVNSALAQPIGCTLKITAKPSYNEHEGKLYLDDFDLKIKPTSFIYKLGAPLFTGYIENQIEEYFPLKINELITDFVENQLPTKFSQDNIEGTITYDSLKLSELIFKEDGVEGFLAYEDLSLQLVVK